MNSKPIKIPGPDQPITVTPAKGRVTVTVNGKRVADTNEALPVSRGSCAVSCTAHDHVAQGLKRSEYRLLESAFSPRRHWTRLNTAARRSPVSAPRSGGV